MRYEYNFADGLELFYKEVCKHKAKLAGLYYDFDYDFFESKIYIDNGVLVGLVVDDENQSSLTNQRIDKWCSIVKKEFGI